MDNSFLIPANSKKSMLIFGFFNVVDLIIFGSGLGITFLFLMTLPKDTLKQLIFIIIPGVIGAFLVLPVPNHHNIRTLIINIYTYYSNRRKYYWRGWCMNNGKR